MCRLWVLHGQSWRKRNRNLHFTAAISRSVIVVFYSKKMSRLGPTLHDLHAEIGKTLVVWGWLEGQMIITGIDWRKAASDAATTSLRQFLVDLAEPRSVRNAIAHGLASARSNPWIADFEPFETCRTLNGEVRAITLSDLRRTQFQLQRLRNVLQLIQPSAIVE